MNDLTILCISAREPHSARFRLEHLRVAVELDAGFRDYDGRGAGILERCQDDAVAGCQPGWVLLMADDERITESMVEWLKSGQFREADNWCFPRAHLWGSERKVILDAPLWPDLQTRLATREKSGGRSRVHEGSPYGSGRVAPVAFEHHKFLVRTVEERQKLLERYAEMWPAAANDHYRAFSLPEPRNVQKWNPRVPVEPWASVAA